MTSKAADEGSRAGVRGPKISEGLTQGMRTAGAQLEGSSRRALGNYQRLPAPDGRH